MSWTQGVNTCQAITIEIGAKYLAEWENHLERLSYNRRSVPCRLNMCPALGYPQEQERRGFVTLVKLSPSRSAPSIWPNGKIKCCRVD
jgi:hypothetical protein